MLLCVCVCVRVCVRACVCVPLCYSYFLAKFKEGMKNNNNIPRTVDQFEHVTEASTDSALKV